MKATDWMTLAGMAVAGLGIETIEAQSWVPVLLIGIGSAVIIAAMKLEKRKSASRRQAKEALHKNAA